jgi:AraC family L-rhamnose operon transcriptional activator RhaR
MYLYKESHTMLNESALVLSGTTACFNVHYWGVIPDLTDNPVHKHSFFEVCFVMDGEGEYTDEGIDYPLRSGTHFCSRPGITHQIRSKKGLFLVFVAFELNESLSYEVMQDAFHYLAENGKPCVQDGHHTPTALLWKSLLIQEKETGNLPSAAVPSLAYSLVLSFLTLFGKMDEKATHRKNSNTLLQQAKLYIRDNLSQSLKLHEVASYLHISGRHLSRLFSASIHESFTQFIRQERIRHAVHLLMTSELSIKEIAEAAGFSSVHYFTRTFMEEKHLPPGKFRQKAKA